MKTKSIAKKPKEKPTKIASQYLLKSPAADKYRFISVYSDNTLTIGAEFQMIPGELKRLYVEVK